MFSCTTVYRSLNTTFSWFGKGSRGLKFRSVYSSIFPELLNLISNASFFDIYSHTLCGGKKLENEGMPFNWGMAEQIVVYVGDRILLYSKE